ncbi:unnamed protein product, partial [Closterium sp. Naga37s-1]
MRPFSPLRSPPLRVNSLTGGRDFGHLLCGERHVAEQQWGVGTGGGLMGDF